MAERERSKYEHPVSSRELIMEHLEQRGEPLVFEQIAHDLDHSGEAEMEGLRRRLGAMVRDGQVMRNRRGGFGLTSSMDLIQGRVQGHKDGFGFLIPDKGGDDMFLSAREMRKVMHGDRVMARVSGVDRRGRTEGSIVEVLEHCNTTVAGRYFFRDGVSGMVPSQTKLSQEVLVSEDGRNGAEDGQMVVVRITHYPEGHRQAIGIVERVLGDYMAPGMEIDVALHSFDLPHEWPEAVDDEAAKVPSRVPPKAKAGREDLRELPLLTIDGEDARDFDDAVYCEPDGKGWRLLVAIADVSHYVQPESALDKEAENRGTSVYFPEQVIPMLPEVLSNGLCSINPKVDRLCMVCEMHLGPRGKVNSWRFFEGVMRSKARLTYNKVAAILDGDKRLRASYKAVVPHLENLHTLYKLLARLRKQRGAIDFDSTETRIVFGPDRKIESIVPVERNDAHRLIEECMIAANVAAGEFLTKHRIPGLYRVHAGPTGDKLIGLRDFLKEMGLELAGGDEPSPREYAKLLNSVKGRPDAQLIQTVMLRSLKQAVYTPENSGHFGLAVKAYSHFTSPIRRFPDLLLHRAIKHIIGGGKAKDFIYGFPQMEHFGEHCSMTSRRADEAGWDVDAWLKAEYMLDKIGQQFTGIVTSVTSFGLFVQLKDVFVEGLVHVSALNNDYYHFDPVHHRLTGERTGKAFRLGDSVEVVISRVDLQERRIDFTLPRDGDEGEEQPKRGRKPKRNKRSRRDAPPAPEEAPAVVADAEMVVSEEPAAVVELPAEPPVEQEQEPAPESAPVSESRQESKPEQEPARTEAKQTQPEARSPVARKKRRRKSRRGPSEAESERPALFDLRPAADEAGQQAPQPPHESDPVPEPPPEQQQPQAKKPRSKKRKQPQRSDADVATEEVASPGNVWTDDDGPADLPDEHLDKVFNGNVVDNSPERQLKAVDNGNRAGGKGKPRSKTNTKPKSKPKGGGKTRSRRRKPAGKRPGKRSDNSGNV